MLKDIGVPKVLIKPTGMRAVSGVTSAFTNVEGKSIFVDESYGWLVNEAINTIQPIAIDVAKLGGNLYISSMWRNSHEQQRTWYDWKLGKKTSYSPPAGYSMHELGRAVDIEVRSEKTGVPHEKIREVMVKHGWSPIVPLGQPGEWHYEFRTPQQQSVLVEEGYLAMLDKAHVASKYQPPRLIQMDKDPDAAVCLNWT